MPRPVVVVPHTHWDREWLEPFPAQQLRLVAMLDRVLPVLDVPFLLDGQMALVDDYLDARPEGEGMLRRLAAEGRLSLGPYYVTIDEFLVSAETLARNLELGLARAAALGPMLEVGYCPDVFGHAAQHPQLLRQAGIAHAVVWRGVPSQVVKTGFWWRAPDGSTVRAEHLPAGYGNGAALPDDAEQLLARIEAHDAELGSWWLDEMLLMNGTDGSEPDPALSATAAEANRRQARYCVEIAGLAAYLGRAATDGLVTVEGELRSGAAGDVLRGTLSARLDLKRAAVDAECLLERGAEPLAAMLLPRNQWPGAVLDRAWLDVVRNGAHDSACGSATDAVADVVRHRYREVATTSRAVVELCMGELGRSMADPGDVVVNPSARARSVLIEVVADGDDDVPGAQVLERLSPVEEDWQGTAPGLAALLGEIRQQRFRGRWVSDLVVNDTGGGLDVEVRLSARCRPNRTVEEQKRRLYTITRSELPARIRVRGGEGQRLLVRVADVPGFGWRAWRPAPIETERVRVDGHRLANGVVDVVVDGASGTVVIDGVAGMDRLVDEGDAGDLYTCSPVGPEVREPSKVTIEVLETGPLRGRLRMVRTYRWPVSVAAPARRREGAADVTVTTDVEVVAGEPLVRFCTRFTNPSCDHRLRSWFPLPRPATGSHAGCAFAVVDRPLTGEGSPAEPGQGTWPSRRFVSAGGLTLFHHGLPEYEVVDGGEALALTLLRSVGVLSRAHLPERQRPAAPSRETPGAQLLGSVEARYAIAVGEVEDPWALADVAFTPAPSVEAPGGGDRPGDGQVLTIAGAQVSSLRHRDGSLEARVFNPTPTSATVEVTGRSGAVVDLAGRALQRFSDRLELGPWRIATLRFD